jgi:hypothetical protein
MHGLALPVLLAAIAAGLSVWVFRRRAAGARVLIAAEGANQMMTLTDAANAVHETGKRERLAMVTMAEHRNRLADPTGWFAASIAGVVPVYQRRADGAFERVDKGHVAQGEISALYILKRDLQTYMRWARSVQ